MTDSELRKLISETVQEELEKLGLKTRPKKPDDNVVDFFSAGKRKGESPDDDPRHAA
jgi:hypothetical protein